MNNKIVRSICAFDQKPGVQTFERLSYYEVKLKERGYEVQTKRMVSCDFEEIMSLSTQYEGYYYGVGSLRYDNIHTLLPRLLASNNISFNIDLTNETINEKHVEILFSIINKAPAKSFNMAYVFNNPPSSPYLPSAWYEKDGIALGLQSTDLAENAHSFNDWFVSMKHVWDEIATVFQNEKDFLGIDSSVAPLFTGKSSLLYHIKRLHGSFPSTTITDIYSQITSYIKKHNPRSIGLCGLMLPTLEDFELANEYELGNFSIERNIYLSLHSGLGIDTYPIGTNEDPTIIVEILKLLQTLSHKYHKPLSVRFVSDGVAQIGQKTNFKNPYLKDVTVRRISL